MEPHKNNKTTNDAQRLRSEIRHRCHLEKMAVIGGFEWNITTDEFWFSSQTKTILRLPKNEIPASLDNLVSAIQLNDQRHVRTSFENLSQNGGHFHFKTHTFSAKGKTTPIFLRAKYDEEEHIVVGYVQDTSEGFQERKNLLDTVSKYRGVMSGASDAIILMSLSGQILEGNAKACELLEVQEEQLSQLSVDDIHHPNDLENLMGHYQSLLWGQTDLVESRVVSQKGTETIVEISGRSVQTDSKQILVIVFRDITKQKKSNEDLKQSEERYRSLVNEAREGILLLNSTGQIIAANPKICETVGLKRLKLLQCNFYDIAKFDTEQLPVPPPAYHSMQIEGYIKSTKGKLYPTGFNIATFEDKGQVQSIVTAYDLTAIRDGEKERIDLQKQLFQSQKLEILGQLASSLAHDFNNLLSPILLVSESLIDTEENNQSLKHNLGIINQAAQRARRLVGRILDYTRPEESEPRLLNFMFELEDTLELFSSSIARNITIETHFPKEKLYCFADPDQIHQLIMNIAMNAAQSIGGNIGTISFTLKSIHINTNSPLLSEFKLIEGPYIQLCVSDTGSGIKEEYLKDIYQPFFTTKPQTDGSGLGLSVVRKIIENHTGAIEAINNPDIGACITVSLPLVKA